jgi:hypothetical protein
MSRSYHAYAARLAQIARQQDQEAEAARRARLQQVRAKRIQMQPQYEALGEWHSAQIKARGLCPEVLAEMDAALKALDQAVEVMA